MYIYLHLFEYIYFVKDSRVGRQSRFPSGFRFRLWLSLFHFRLINYIIKLAAMGLKDSLPKAPNKSHVYGESFKLPSYSVTLLPLSSVRVACGCFCSYSCWRTHSICLRLDSLGTLQV